MDPARDSDAEDGEESSVELHSSDSVVSDTGESSLKRLRWGKLNEAAVFAILPVFLKLSVQSYF